MKPPFLFLLFLVTYLASCAHYEGNGYKATIVGTNHKGYKQSANQLSFDESNQSQVALSAIRTAGTLGTSYIAGQVAETLSNNSTKEVLGSQSVEKAAITGSHATQQLGIKESAQTERLKLLPK